MPSIHERTNILNVIPFISANLLANTKFNMATTVIAMITRGKVIFIIQTYDLLVLFFRSFMSLSVIKS